jgi:hypothetical protein
VGDHRLRDLFGGFLLLGGRLADLLGRGGCSSPARALHGQLAARRLAWSEGSLIAFRALQGLGARCSRPPRSRS